MISGCSVFAFCHRTLSTRVSVTLAFALVGSGIPVRAQGAQLKTADAVLGSLSLKHNKFHGLWRQGTR